MNVTPDTASANTDAPAVADRITVALIPKAAGDLGRLQGRTSLGKTDIVNRAISAYEFFDAQLSAGKEIHVRDPQSGRSEIVRFL